MTDPTLYDKIETEILDHFDFTRAQLVYQALDWTIMFEQGSLHVPCVSDLRALARRLLREVADDYQRGNDILGVAPYRVSRMTAGLRAEALKDSNGRCVFQLEMVVEQWDNFD